MTAHSHDPGGYSNGGGPTLADRVGVLEDRADDADSERGATLAAIGDLSRLIERNHKIVMASLDRVEALSTITAVKVGRLTTEGDVTVEERRALRRDVDKLKDDRYRDKLDSHREIEETEKAMKQDAEKIAEGVVTKAQLATTREALAETKETSRHWGRWVAEKAAFLVLGVCVGLLIKYLTR